LTEIKSKKRERLGIDDEMRVFSTMTESRFDLICSQKTGTSIALNLQKKVFKANLFFQLVCREFFKFFSVLQFKNKFC